MHIILGIRFINQAHCLHIQFDVGLSDSIVNMEYAENALNAVRFFCCWSSFRIIIHKKNRLAREFLHKKCTIPHFSVHV